ncbi:SGNH/GDSL hydrolase family protein [Gordonia insulae]|uniref:Lipase 2 n=1 Tax=Gordonia insulae TaxID=2420509 RepID=A0A3G8JTK0_9ACTN|nr:SGNH/GDSL hydrolase family protein [Gordonia insulae]AZG48045.1 Lipase 2 [Gordonia insulae]
MARTRVATMIAILSVVAMVGAGIAIAEMRSPTVNAAAQAEHPSLKYVALGSSYAAGPGVQRLTDKGCLRTADNYPHQIAAARGMALTDVSCSGATTANILHTPQAPHAKRPQITAVTADTDLVTITIGGNDLAYIGRVAAQGCANMASTATAGTVISGCRPGQRIRTEPTAADYAAVEQAIITIVSEVRSRAPHADVVLVDYPPLLDQHARTCAQIPLTAAEAAETVRVYNGLVAATARAAGATGVTLVKASKAGAAHTACSSQPWLLGFEPPSPYHPTELGKTGVARLVLRALRGDV